MTNPTASHFFNHCLVGLSVLPYTGHQGPESCYRLNPAGNSTCGKHATKSQRKVLRSSPWAHHFLLHPHLVTDLCNWRRFPFDVGSEPLAETTSKLHLLSVQKSRFSTNDQHTSLINVPFFVAGTLKNICDLFLYWAFVAVRRPEEAR